MDDCAGEGSVLNHECYEEIKLGKKGTTGNRQVKRALGERDKRGPRSGPPKGWGKRGLITP